MDDDNTSPAGYNNTHRALLQALLARPTLTLTTAKPLIAAIETAASNGARPIPPEDITQEDLENYVEMLNTHISAFDLDIRYTLHQRSKERVYALVNTSSDALTQMSTLHSADEIAFVKRVLDAMFDTYNTHRAEVMAVTSMQALKLAKVGGGGGESQRRQSTQQQANGQTQAPGAANASLTMSQAETILASMIAEGWFELSPRGFYSLTPRALMELRGWLVETYNASPDSDEDDEEDEIPHIKIKDCAACRQIVTVGQRCPNSVCLTRLHDYCVRNAFRANGGREECPVCRTRWVEAPVVGEGAAKKGGGGGGRESQGRRVSGQASGGARGGRRTQSGPIEVESESEESDD